MKGRPLRDSKDTIGCQGFTGVNAHRTSIGTLNALDALRLSSAPKGKEKVKDKTYEYSSRAPDDLAQFGKEYGEAGQLLLRKAGR